MDRSRIDMLTPAENRLAVVLPALRRRLHALAQITGTSKGKVNRLCDSLDARVTDIIRNLALQYQRNVAAKPPFRAGGKP